LTSELVVTLSSLTRDVAVHRTLSPRKHHSRSDDHG